MLWSFPKNQPTPFPSSPQWLSFPTARQQQERFKKFTSTIQNNSRPPDMPKNELMEALTKKVPPKVKSYLHELPELVVNAKLKGLSVQCIDDCLWLVAMTEKWVTDLGGAEKLPHLLFHLKHPKLKCQIGEIEALNRESPLINLAAHNMNHPISRSPLIWYPKDLVLDVIMGRIIVFAQFDLDAFFRLAEKNGGFKLSFLTGKEVEAYMRSSEPMLENHDAFGIKVIFPNGHALSFRPSVFRAVYSDFVLPCEILRLITIVDETQNGLG
jgi:hypothetical protein